MQLSTEPYRILVCIGPDPNDDRIYAEAVDVALRHLRVELHAVHVVEDRLTADTSEGFRLLEERLEAAPVRLRERLQRAAEQAPFMQAVTVQVLTGDPAHAILQAAVDIQADLIVVGTARATGLRRFLLGSVSETVVADAHCSVMVASGKNYAGLKRSQQPDPPCTACLRQRAASCGAVYWCGIHARPYLTTQVIEPTDHTSPSSLPTGLRIV